MADVLDPAEATLQGRNQSESATVDTPPDPPEQQESDHVHTTNIQDTNQLEEEESDNQAVTTDILQQAFVEASGGEITHIDEELEDQQQLCLSPDKQQLDDLEKSVEQDGDNDNVNQPTNFDNALNNLAEEDSAAFPLASEPIQPPPATIISGEQQNAGEFPLINTTTEVVSSNPLGSKANPIRIIQQGNTYKSTQKLSEEQIQQIVQVLQKQNLASKTVNGGPTAVYNPETNTRIVYRVVQPHEKTVNRSSTGLASLVAGDKSESTYSYPKRGRGRPKKRKRTQSESTDSGDESDPPFEGDSDSEAGDMAHLDAGRELSPTEKLRKKREKPKTRSGRVSKPPSHMVKDYKQIHRVDWYEDYDDDDGGYSDIYDSDTEAQSAHPADAAKAKKTFGCSQCEKAYIGVKSLARHFRMTGHGDPTELFIPEDPKPKAEEADSTAAGAAAGAAAGDAGNVVRPRGRPRKRPIEDEAWKPPAYVKTGEPGKPGRPSHTDPQSILQSLDGPGPGRPPLSFWERRVKRMEKLNTTLSTYSCTEVLQTIASRMKKDSTSLFDILNAGMATVEGEQRPSYTCMLQLYTELQAKMTELAKTCLRPLMEGESVSEDKEAIQIVTEVIAHSIGIEPGLFEVSDLPRSTICMPANQSTTSQSTEKMNEETTPAADQGDTVSSAPEIPESNSSVDVQPISSVDKTLTSKTLTDDDADVPMESEPEVAEPSVDGGASPTAAAANSASAIADAVSKLMPGDIITLDGQKIVIPDGAHIVQSADGVIIYESKEPDAACIVNLKLGLD